MKAKEKIALLVSGKISMKEIQALEEQEAREAAEEEAAKQAKEEKQDEEPDYKALYEELLKTEKKAEEEPKIDYKELYEAEAAKVTKLQQQNINQNLKKEDEPEKSIEDILIGAYSNS